MCIRDSSKRGLDTRVSLKQALAAQGFTGGSRGDTEWNHWVQSEKEQLAVVMERHGIEWEHKGTHEKHLSVLDYKKQEREKEINALKNLSLIHIFWWATWPLKARRPAGLPT